MACDMLNAAVSIRLNEQHTDIKNLLYVVLQCLYFSKVA